MIDPRVVQPTIIARAAHRRTLPFGMPRGFVAMAAARNRRFFLLLHCDTLDGSTPDP
jgi:hypothetical protein